ncbi:Hypothetical predicted protein [Mytilus galloprovincialis]|uniref:SWIM-type domain-containing protein n=1 Tax=Mytilus galloprovincialis TaxID=29158 RepID=A0A8B6G997_MYTGA|nr:Hypothetical predicted protein [Mytilus galloprovincialis]
MLSWESAVPLRYSEQQQAARIKEEYTSRLKNADIDDPRSFLDSVWSDDVKLWPTIDLGMIFSFILKNKEQDLDFVGKYKTQKAYSYYESGFVDVIKSTTVRDNTVIKSRVTPSQSVRNEPHEVWISIKANEIKSCWCSCIAGMAQTCNHVIAVLYKLEYATTMGYNNLACTSQPCGWNSSTKKDVKPCRLSELSLRCDNRSKVSGATAQEDKDVNANFKMKFDPRREDHVVSTDAEVENLYASLYSVRPKSVLFTGFPSLTKKMKYPDTIISSAEKFITSNINDVDFVESLSLSSDEAALIEITTRGQSSNAQWMEQRKGRITASIIHEVGYKMSEIVKKKNVKTSPLVAKVCGKYKSIGHLESIKYGKNNEVTARNLFSILESQNHRNLKVDQCGLFVKADRPYIAASPDAIVTCTCCSSKATLEIKCPISVTDISISTEGWKKLDYLEMDEGKLRLKQSHTHYTQVQTQMAVTGCKVAYFFVWSPKGSFCEKN